MEYWYDPLPPLAVNVISPSLSPLHVGWVTEVVKLTAVGIVIVLSYVLVHPSPSFIVIVYVPEDRGE